MGETNYYSSIEIPSDCRKKSSILIVKSPENQCISLAYALLGCLWTHIDYEENYCQGSRHSPSPLLLHLARLVYFWESYILRKDKEQRCFCPFFLLRGSWIGKCLNYENHHRISNQGILCRNNMILCDWYPWLWPPLGADFYSAVNLP